MNLENINIILNNNKNCYHGHGTNGDDNVISSIFNNGLRCSNNSMYFTTCTLGIGGEIDDEIYDKLNNWPHQDADNVVIVSLPIKYNILELPELGTVHSGYDAFCYSVENNENLLQGKYVKPEFIVGCYNARTKEFKKNDKYYELLSQEEQKKLFEQVKENYAQTIEESCGLEFYREVLSNLPQWQFPLTDEECENLVKNDSSSKLYI